MKQIITFQTEQQLTMLNPIIFPRFSILHSSNFPHNAVRPQTGKLIGFLQSSPHVLPSSPLEQFQNHQTLKDTAEHLPPLKPSPPQFWDAKLLGILDSPVFLLAGFCNICYHHLPILTTTYLKKFTYPSYHHFFNALLFIILYIQMALSFFQL